MKNKIYTWYILLVNIISIDLILIMIDARGDDGTNGVIMDYARNPWKIPIPNVVM